LGRKAGKQPFDYECRGGLGVDPNKVKFAEAGVLELVHDLLDLAASLCHQRVLDGSLRAKGSTGCGVLYRHP
jgi:hypothetical protein